MDGVESPQHAVGRRRAVDGAYCGRRVARGREHCRRRPDRVDPPAGVVARRRPALRVRPLGLVEPLPNRRRLCPTIGADGRGVRCPAVGCGHENLCLRIGGTNRVRIQSARHLGPCQHRHGDAGADRDRLAVHGYRQRRHQGVAGANRVRGEFGDGTRRDHPAECRHGRHGRVQAIGRGRGRRGLPVDPRDYRVPDR